MKKLLLTTLLTLGLTTMGAQALNAQNQKEKEKTTYGFLNNTITNKNIFVGMNFGNTYMNQPYVEVGNDDLSFGTWANFDIKENKATEVDYYLTGKKNVSLGENTSLDLAGTFAYYTFPNSTFGDVKELKLNTTLNTKNFPLTFGAGKVFSEAEKGWHASLSSSKDFDLSSITDNLSATIDAEVFYNNAYFTQNKGLSHIREGASLSYDVSSDLNLTLKANTQQRLNNSFRDQVFNETYLTFGVTKKF